MSDYLANLAARTLAAPPLQPRVRMRFEPETAPEPAALPDAIAAAPREPRAPDAPRAQQPPRVIERERVREVATPGRETTRVVTIEATPAAAAAPPPEPEVIEHTERIETIKALPAAPAEGSGRLVRSVPSKSGRDVRSPLLPLLPQDQEAPRPHRYDEEPPRVVAKEPPIRERRAPIEPAPLAVPDSEPIVQVSIGRIDIRATTAPPAQRKGRGRTAMTIDDYIAKRDARERR